MRFTNGDIVRLSLTTIPDDPWGRFVGVVAAVCMVPHFHVNTVPAVDGMIEQVEVLWLNDIQQRNPCSEIVIPQKWLEHDLRLHCHAF